MESFGKHDSIISCENILSIDQELSKLSDMIIESNEILSTTVLNIACN